jgi:uncharacterized protein (DUF427 family)
MRWRTVASPPACKGTALDPNSPEEKTMSERVVIVPGAAHPITTEANPARVIVRARGRVVADSVRTLTLREASYPPVHYIPRTDVDMAAVSRSAHGSYCPYKGEATYFSIEAEGGCIVNAAWTYEHPFATLAVIKDYVAFYPDRVDSITETLAAVAV